MNKPHIAAIVTAHREGLIASPGLRSLSRAKSHAERNGFAVEVVVVLDRADSLTEDIVRKWATPDTKILRVANGDPGLSRNDGVEACSGEWVAFLDADDLWGVNWLTSGLRAASYDRRNIIWHPEACLYFGMCERYFRHIDMESDEFNLASLNLTNYWSALCIARRNSSRKQIYRYRPSWL